MWHYSHKVAQSPICIRTFPVVGVTGSTKSQPHSLLPSTRRSHHFAVVLAPGSKSRGAGPTPHPRRQRQPGACSRRPQSFLTWLGQDKRYVRSRGQIQNASIPDLFFESCRSRVVWSISARSDSETSGPSLAGAFANSRGPPVLILGPDVRVHLGLFGPPRLLK